MSNNIDVRDNTTGASKTVKTTSTADIHTPHHSVDNLTIALPASMVYGIKQQTSVGVKAELIAAPVGSPDLSLRNYVCAVQVANYGGSASLVAIYDGAATSPDVALTYIYAPANTTIPVTYPIPLKATAGNAIDFSISAGTVYVSAQGYTAA